MIASGDVVLDVHVAIALAAIGLNGLGIGFTVPSGAQLVLTA